MTTFDPTLRKLPMQNAEAFCIAWGGTVRRNGCGELVFRHPLADRPLTCNSTRRETSDRLLAWLRHLNERRAILREAFELEEIA